MVLSGACLVSSRTESPPRYRHSDVGSAVTVQLESNGDPWQNYPDVDAASVNYFWDYVYFVLIVLTTIGFGDISPITTLGKLFLVFYVLLCLVS